MLCSRELFFNTLYLLLNGVASNFFSYACLTHLASHRQSLPCLVSLVIFVPIFIVLHFICLPSLLLFWELSLLGTVGAVDDMTSPVLLGVNLWLRLANKSITFPLKHCDWSKDGHVIQAAPGSLSRIDMDGQGERLTYLEAMQEYVNLVLSGLIFSIM